MRHLIPSCRAVNHCQLLVSRFTFQNDDDVWLQLCTVTMTRSRTLGQDVADLVLFSVRQLTDACGKLRRTSCTITIIIIISSSSSSSSSIHSHCCHGRRHGGSVGRMHWGVCTPVILPKLTLFDYHDQFWNSQIFNPDGTPAVVLSSSPRSSSPPYVYYHLTFHHHRRQQQQGHQLGGWLSNLTSVRTLGT